MNEDIELRQQGGSHRLTTIVAVDVCDYSKMSETDELSAIQLMDDIFKICQKLVTRFRGRIFKTIADATLVEFQSTQDAIFFAVALREDVTKQTQWRGQPNSVETRIGIHVGDVVDRIDGDILGHGVNIAVRLQEKAPRNGIMASSNVVNLISRETGLNLKSVGKVSLKNIDRPIGGFLVQQSNGWQHFYRWSLKPNLRVLIASLVMIIAAFSFNHFKGGFAGKNEISPEAVSATLYNLRQSPFPISDMFAALNRENSFDGALKFLIEQYDKKQSVMSDKDKIDLLHQIAALAMNRNSPEAEKAYRKILSLKADPEALLQLAIILRKRGDIVQARDFLRRARKAVENISYSPQRIRLGIKIESTVLNGRYGPDGNILKTPSEADLFAAEKVLAQIADSEESKSHKDLRLRAKYNALMLQFMGLYQTDQDGSENVKLTAYLRIIEELKSVIDEQGQYSFVYDLSESYSTLSTIQNVVHDYDASIQSLEKSLNIEYRLVRPSKTIATHANLAYANVASHSEGTEKLDKAEYHVNKVREISKAENRVNREYYNLYVLALIEDKRGNRVQACSYFDSARLLWPKSSLPKGFLPELDKDLGCNFYSNFKPD